MTLQYQLKERGVRKQTADLPNVMKCLNLLWPTGPEESMVRSPYYRHTCSSMVFQGVEGEDRLRILLVCRIF